MTAWDYLFLIKLLSFLGFIFYHQATFSAYVGLYTKIRCVNKLVYDIPNAKKTQLKCGAS